jgi:ABC-2 type transport system ATP-binding protein
MIEIKNLEKSFGDKVVLDKLSFSIARNTIYGLLGPNGAGKTTTINILSDLLDADAGTITMNGNFTPEKRKHFIGVVPQEISVYQDLTCIENLLFFARLYGLRGVTRSERVEQLIQMLNLTVYRNTRVSKLSGGWKRRLNIAVALVHSPQILILDEPTAGLDVEARHELWDNIKSLRNNGVGILMTTHQLEEAEKLCTTIGILKKGRIVAEGNLYELRKVVPATIIAHIETEDKPAFYQKMKALHWEYRPYGGGFIVYLPERITLKEVVSYLNGIPLRSISLQEIGLEHIYLEITREFDEDPFTIHSGRINIRS